MKTNMRNKPYAVHLKKKDIVLQNVQLLSQMKLILLYYDARCIQKV